MNSQTLSLAGAFGEATLGEAADKGSAIAPSSSKAFAFSSLGLTAGSRVPAISDGPVSPGAYMGNVGMVIVSSLWAFFSICSAM